MGGIPARPHGVIDDPIWEILEECWKTPQERPPIVGVYRTLKSYPTVNHTIQRQPVVGGLPGTLKLNVHSIKSFGHQPGSYQFYVKFKYGSKGYTTSPTNLTNAWHQSTWFALYSLQLLLLLLSLT